MAYVKQISKPVAQTETKPVGAKPSFNLTVSRNNELVQISGLWEKQSKATGKLMFSAIMKEDFTIKAGEWLNLFPNLPKA